MKKFYVLIIFLSCLLVQQSFAQRFVSDVFADEDIVVMQDVMYGVNMSVFAQIFVPDVDVPIRDTLLTDIYMPDIAKDDLAQRPVIFINGSGGLPQYVTECFGDKADIFRVHIAQRMARRGFVVVVIESRTGFNPFAPTNDQLVGTLSAAAIRQSIDFRTAARFIRRDIAENGNTYGINPDEFIAWGASIGTNEINAALATKVEEYQTPSFFILNAEDSLVNVVDLTLQGGLWGDSDGVDPDGNVSNIPNHAEFAQEYQFDLVVAARGVLLDTLLIQPNEPPMIHYVNKNNIGSIIEVAPFNLPATGEFCCNVFFAQLHQRQADEAGNVDLWKGVEFTDPVANARADYPPDPSYGEVEGLIALSGDAGNQVPWVFWDTTTCNAIAPAVNEANLESFAGMSPELGMSMMDTVIRYWTPRACVLFGWESCGDITTNVSTSTTELLVDNNRVNVSPNPSDGQLIFASKEAFPMERVSIFSVAGNLVYEVEVENNQYTIDDVGLPNGMYIAKIKFEDGVASKKLNITR